MRVRALYNDGRVAMTYRVTVGIDASGLAIMSDDEQRVDHWPADGLQLVERPSGRVPFRVCRQDSPARLTFAAPVITSFAEYFPDLRLRGHVERRAWLQMAGWAAGALAVASIVLKLTAPLIAQPLAALISEPAKARLGDRLAGQAVAAMAARDGRRFDDMFCYDPASAAALQELLSVLAQGPARDLRFGVRVIDSAETELFALPGGQILMSGRVVEAAGSADAMAGLMAHQMGHVARDDPMRALLLADPVAVLFSLMPIDGSTSVFDASLADQYMRRRHRRSDEGNAQSFALDLLNGIGVAVGPYADFLAARVDAGAETAEPLARMHPVSERHIAMIREGGSGEFLALPPERWRALRGLCR